MGMFYTKLVESAVDDAIQTPGDIGVDLDAIEKNIMGDDGIEAHRDEVEAAEEGIIGDPLDEAMIIMYESEYNFNQLMKCIGIAELNEMANGRDFILEGGNLKEFFKNASEAIVNMFKHITEVFKNAVTKLHAAMSNDKKLIEKHYGEINAGYISKKEWSYKCFDMNALKTGAEKVPSEKAFNTLEQNAKNAVETARRTGVKWDLNNDDKLKHANIAKGVSGLEISDNDNAAGAMRDALVKMTFVEVLYNNSNKPDINIITKTLKETGDIKKVKENYNKLKANYKGLLKHLKDLEHQVAKGETEADANAKAVCLAYISAHRYEKNLQNIMFSNCIKAIRTMRKQARHLALVWQRLGTGAKTEPEENPKLLTSATEGALLRGIKII